MSKMETISFEITPEQKQAVNAIFAQNGYDFDKGVAMLFDTIIYQGELPYVQREFNDTTLEAIEELRHPAKKAKLVRYKSVNDAFAALSSEEDVGD